MDIRYLSAREGSSGKWIRGNGEMTQSGNSIMHGDNG